MRSLLRQSPGMATWIVAVLFGLNVFLIGFTFSGTAFLIKHEAYRHNGVAIVTRVACTVVPQLLLFWLMPDARGLILGFSLGVFAQASVACRRREAAWPPTNIAARHGRHASTLPTISAVRRAKHLPLDVRALCGELFHPRPLWRQRGWLFRLRFPAGRAADGLARRLRCPRSSSRRRPNPSRRAAAIGCRCGSTWSSRADWPRRSSSQPCCWRGGRSTFTSGSHWGPVADVLIILAPMMAARFVFITVSAAPLVTGRTGWLLARQCGLALAMAGVFLLAKCTRRRFRNLSHALQPEQAIIYLLLVAAITRPAHRHYREAGAGPERAQFGGRGVGNQHRSVRPLENEIGPCRNRARASVDGGSKIGERAGPAQAR